MERYESLGLVGEGSYGTVLKCRHRDSGRLVAIKKFTDSDDDKTVKKIALREIRLLRQLRHGNLVNLLEVWKRRRRWYLVFEFVERTLLDDLEQNPSGLDLTTGREYLYQILRAAAFCHQQNIIHRDIKPENILISQGGVVKLCDFGFARAMASSADGDVYTDYVATRWYRAPELLVGDIRYGKPVDVWAVGCLLLEMLTGQPLFPGDSDLDQIYHITRCFGNLTEHHQELFYRNPVFSGVKLPQCYDHVLLLQQRFPSIPPTALDMAQSCLQMDPERRAQCLELLEHPLFTQDSFHIRFLNELNAKIQKDHRENSTLPKITKIPKREKDEGNQKSQGDKDKKKVEGIGEKVNKEKEKKNKKEQEKLEKTKGKQPSQLSKTVRNTSEPLMSTKQSKKLGARVIDNAARTSVSMKIKPAKAIGSGLKKELEILKSVKNLTSDSLGGAKVTGLKGAKPWVHGIVASPESRENQLKNTEDSDSSGSDTAVSSETKKNVKDICRSSKLKPSPECGTIHSNASSSSKASLESAVHQTDATLALQARQPSSHIEVTPSTISSATKPRKTTSEYKTDPLASDPGQRRPWECPKVLPSNPKLSDTTSSSSPEIIKTINPSKSLITDLSTPSFAFSVEAAPAHSIVTLPRGISNSKLSKTDSTSICKPTNDTTCVPNNHSASVATATVKAQKTTCPTEARKKSDNTERTDATNIPTITDSIPSTAPPDHRASKRSLVLCNLGPMDLNELEFTASRSSPPPPPSSTPLLLPPSSTTLVPSFCIVSANDHLTLGAGFHPGNHSLRCVDKPRHHGAIHSRLAQQTLPSHTTASVTVQVSGKSLIRERSFLYERCHFGTGAGAAMAKKKSDIHFPDLSSSVLPELRGRDGKHSKGVTKDPRKDKQTVPSISPSEPQQH